MDTNVVVTINGDVDQETTNRVNAFIDELNAAGISARLAQQEADEADESEQPTS